MSHRCVHDHTQRRGRPSICLTANLSLVVEAEDPMKEQPNADDR